MIYYMVSFRYYGGKCGNKVLFIEEVEKFIKKEMENWTNWSVWSFRNKELSSINEVDLIAEGKNEY